MEPTEPEEPAEPTYAELINHNLRKNFYEGQYRAALTDFLSMLESGSLTEDEKGLVIFYTGQCYFYLGEYEKAVKQFIISKEFPAYHDGAEMWMKRSLGRVK